MRPVLLMWRRREEEKDHTLLLCPIMTDRTCPVAVEQLWELSRLDRTLSLMCPVVIELTRPVATGTLLKVTGHWSLTSDLGTVLRPVVT